MNLETMESDLLEFKKNIQLLNNEIDSLERKRKELLTTAVRIEGAIAYLNTKIAEEKKAGTLKTLAAEV